MSREFTIVAKEDGTIIDEQDGILIIQYKSGAYDSIDTNKMVRKNASSGFFIETELKTDKKVGDRVKQNEVIAWNDKNFTKNKDKSVSMNLGTLAKVAVLPNWDIYEDSAPCTEKLANELATVMIMHKTVGLDKDTFVQKIVKVGDKVKVGDALIVFDEFPDDPDAAAFLDALKDELKEDIIESTINTVKSKYTGVVTDITIHSTVELDELSPSLKNIVSSYYNKLKKKDKFLEKYKNEGDTKFYKCNQLLTEAASKIEADYQGKIKGETVNEGILITFYIKFTDIVSTGDKIVQRAALKSIISHVIEKGYEPFTENNPEEEISTIISPLSISARKTPSIFYDMFTNKLLINLKKQLKEDYYKD